MARPREFDMDFVQDALRDVFWEHGYEGTSYADIMAATGLQKGSLYAAFGDKRALYQIALARYDSAQVSAGVSMLGDDSASPRERISNLFDALIDAAQTPQGRWGCLLCNAATDRAPICEQAEAAVSAGFERMRDAIADCLLDSRAEGASELIWAAYFGGRILIKGGATKDTLRTLKRQALMQFE